MHQHTLSKEFETMKAIIVIGKNTVVDREGSLPRLWGLTLLERSLHTLQKAGINDFLIACGLHYEYINRYIEDKKLGRVFNLELYINIEAISTIDDQILVVDHNVIFDENIVRDLLTKENNNSIICVDSSPRYAKTEIEATKDFLNVGIFLFNKQDIHLIENVIHVASISKDTIREYGLEVLDLRGNNWYKVETENDLKTVKEGILCQLAMNPQYQTHDPDFVISIGYRIITKFVLKYIVNTPITPNQISILGLLPYCLAAYLFSFGYPAYNIIAGILMISTIIFDYLDGMVARLKFKTTKFGGLLEHIIDPIGFYAIIFGMCYGMYHQTNTIIPFILGMVLVMSFSFSSFLNKQYEEVFNEAIEELIQKKIIETGSLFAKFYRFFCIITRQGVWLLIGAFFNILLISFGIIIVSTNILTMISIYLIVKNKQGM